MNNDPDPVEQPTPEADDEGAHWEEHVALSDLWWHMAEARRHAQGTLQHLTYTGVLGEVESLGTHLLMDRLYSAVDTNDRAAALATRRLFITLRDRLETLDACPPEGHASTREDLPESRRPPLHPADQHLFNEDGSPITRGRLHARPGYFEDPDSDDDLNLD